MFFTNVLILVVKIVSTIPLLLLLSSLSFVDIITGKVGQQLVLFILTGMANTERVSRHALRLIAHSISQKVAALEIGRQAIMCCLRQLRNVNVNFIWRCERIKVGLAFMLKALD